MERTAGEWGGWGQRASQNTQSVLNSKPGELAQLTLVAVVRRNHCGRGISIVKPMSHDSNIMACLSPRAQFVQQRRTFSCVCGSVPKRIGVLLAGASAMREGRPHRNQAITKFLPGCMNSSVQGVN